jgi:hypothetical protein
MSGSCKSGAMPREAVWVRLISKGLSCLLGTVFVIAAIRVMAVPEQSWHLLYLRGLLAPFLKDFLSFFHFPYATFYIHSFILCFSLIT